MNEEAELSIYDIALTTLDGRSTTMAEYKGNVLLVVNVASRCGFTPQYTGLEQLYERYSEQGFAVLGFPCNQFLFQEPGGSEQIAKYCKSVHNVTFPMFEKVNVRGRNRHPLYAELSHTKDADGKAGRVKWNFEKFLVSRDGQPLRRYRSRTTPEEIAPHIEVNL
ncbi:MAG: Peroxiredoxin [Frankiales bacterium]|nr:Peroxiredoxin [Frankiales bacterium]